MNAQFYYYLNYLPTRYNATYKQEQDRITVYRFKDGVCDDDVYMWIKIHLNNLCRFYHSGTILICAIPASTKIKTYNRYNKLLNKLSCDLNINNGFSSIVTKNDIAAGHCNNKNMESQHNFIIDSKTIVGKNVVLIDDVITTGRTFNNIKTELLKLGALNVTGLFIAKTIKMNSSNNHSPYNAINDSSDFDDTDIPYDDEVDISDYCESEYDYE